MAVGAAQISSWTQPGDRDAAVRTHRAVRDALAAGAGLQGCDYEVFLQGSYANATNTRGDSDVDIVVMLTSNHVADTSLLGAADRQRFDADRTPGTATAAGFRRGVKAALQQAFGAGGVRDGNKCLTVPGAAGRVDADVVPALLLRRYLDYPPHGRPRWLEGIEIRPLAGPAIVNFPKAHSANGEAKNAAAQGRYKPTVRQVKRLRRLAVERGLLQQQDAPGYLLECMVYNAPAALFVPDDTDRLTGVVAWLAALAPAALLRMTSCDEVHRLFLDDPGGHDPARAARVAGTLRGLL